MSEIQELAEKLSTWIREQASKADCRGVVFGLSGGVDSSVVAVLCKMALQENTLAVIMPCHSSQMDTDHAQKVVQKFDIPFTIVPLDTVFDSLIAVLPSEGLAPETQRRAEANLKPRLRMLTLYYLANSLNYLVVGTSNRSELAVGYCSKYGDSGVDIMPLGNLVKSQVFDLARYLGIPAEIIEKPPSAGLWEGQTDEGELGITYAELDRYLTTRRARAAVRRRVAALARANAHKKKRPPIPP